MRELFDALTAHLLEAARPEETLLCAFAGEEGDFVRFNQSAIRQAGHVRDSTLSFDLAIEGRHAGAKTTLSGDLTVDRASLSRQLERLRAQLPHIPQDPHYAANTTPLSTSRVAPDQLPPSDAITDALLSRAKEHDLVGVLASGAIHRGFANSLGQRNWFTSNSFHLDWSLYDRADKAVKSSYAGVAYKEAELERRMAQAAHRLELLRRPAKKISPGGYRVFLTPKALAGFVSLVSYDGFSEKARRTSSCNLGRAAKGEHLNAKVTLTENLAEGIGPDFNDQGYIKPDRVRLIEGGVCVDTLVSPRSAQEYDVPTNGSGSYEMPEALDMAPGELPTDEVLAKLDTGVWIGHLHYLNFSDHPAGRITGMTRFATLWVENGEVVAPLQVMRFDETVYRVLGTTLVDLTRERELFLDEKTYRGRSTRCTRTPGALVDDFQFTL